MKKTILILTLVACLSLGCLAGCSQSKPASNDTDKNKTEQTDSGTTNTSGTDEEGTDEGEEDATNETRYLIINDEPFCVTAADGFNNYGFTVFTCDGTDDYVFTAKDSGDVTWSVYLMDEPFDDAARYIPQACTADLEGDGTLSIKDGQLVYIQCSASDFSDDEAPEGPYLEITRA